MWLTAKCVLWDIYLTEIYVAVISRTEGIIFFLNGLAHLAYADRKNFLGAHGRPERLFFFPEYNTLVRNVHMLHTLLKRGYEELDCCGKLNVFFSYAEDCDNALIDWNWLQIFNYSLFIFNYLNVQLLYLVGYLVFRII